jgi:hypothetical protein
VAVVVAVAVVVGEGVRVGIGVGVKAGFSVVARVGRTAVSLSATGVSKGSARPQAVSKISQRSR